MWRGCDDSAEVVNLGVLSGLVWQCHLRIILTQNVRKDCIFEYLLERMKKKKNINILNKKQIRQKKRKEKKTAVMIVLPNIYRNLWEKNIIV